MAVTNADRISKALTHTRDGLRPIIDRALRSWIGPDWINRVNGSSNRPVATPNTDDLSLLLSAILAPQFWNGFWSRQFSAGHRALIFELRDVRNRWAHQESFSSDDAYRAMDTMERVLEAFNAREQRGLVRSLRVELQRQVFDEERRNEERRVGRTVKGDPQAGLTPWRDIVTPHEDVAFGRFEQAEFAANLLDVDEGTADAQYLDPRTFFARTYLTQGLRGLIVGAAKRLSGMGGDPVVELQTNFGGGKTHSLIALYHLASGTSITDLPGVGEALVEENLTVPNNVSRAVLVGNQISPAAPEEVEDGVRLRTLWGRMAYQLGGREGYEIVRVDDEAGTNPGARLSQLFEMCSPALILIDEWVAYARQLRDGGDGERLAGGDFDTQFTFAQALTENVERVPGVMALISVPSSDIEVGGERGHQALIKLRNVVTRKAAQWQPAQSEESFEIVRRRLFDEITPDKARVRDVVIDAYMRMYGASRNQFPVEVGERRYRERMVSTYPIHPALFDHLFGEWSSLDKFQRTRGVLRLIALAIANLWSAGDKSLMIMPGTLPIHSSAFASELKKYLDDGWDPVIRSDIDGANSEPVKLDLAHRHFGRISAARRVARTVYMGSAPGQSGSQRIDAREVVLGSAQPGESPAQFSDALSQLSATSNHLYVDGGHYWYSLQPNVTRLANDRAANHSDIDADNIIRSRITRQRDRGAFIGVHTFASGPGDVDDRDDGVRLVVLDPSAPHSGGSESSPAINLASTILAQRSAGPRINRNMLVFVAANADRLQELRQSARLYLAWESIVADNERLDLTAHQLGQARSRLSESNSQVDSQIVETFRHLLVPTQQPKTPAIEWQVTPVSGGRSVAEAASKRLEADERVIANFSPRRIRMDLDDRRLWSENNDIGVKGLWEIYCRYPYMARLATVDVLLRAIADATRQLDTGDLFVYEPKSDRPPVLNGRLIHPAHVVIDPPPLPPTPPDPQKSAKTRFFANFEVDSVRGNSQMNEILANVVSHLGENVKISLEIESTSDGDQGFDEQVRRTVAENARHLGAIQSEFTN